MERANHKFVSCPAVDLCDGVGAEGHTSGVNTCTCLSPYIQYLCHVYWLRSPYLSVLLCFCLALYLLFIIIISYHSFSITACPTVCVSTSLSSTVSTFPCICFLLFVSLSAPVFLSYSWSFFMPVLLVLSCLCFLKFLHLIHVFVHCFFLSTRYNNSSAIVFLSVHMSVFLFILADFVFSLFPSFFCHPVSSVPVSLSHLCLYLSKCNRSWVKPEWIIYQMSCGY